ncbi:hypothetical protein BVY02_01240 [bacterium J17]|nr:hypothetical protein BVY02_01240 [bacterium J17]
MDFSLFSKQLLNSLPDSVATDTTVANDAVRNSKNLEKLNQLSQEFVRVLEKKPPSDELVKAANPLLDALGIKSKDLAVLRQATNLPSQRVDLSTLDDFAIEAELKTALKSTLSHFSMNSDSPVEVAAQVAKSSMQATLNEAINTITSSILAIDEIANQASVPSNDALVREIEAKMKELLRLYDSGMSPVKEMAEIATANISINEEPRDLEQKSASSRSSLDRLIDEMIRLRPKIVENAGISSRALGSFIEQQLISLPDRVENIRSTLRSTESAEGLLLLQSTIAEASQSKGVELRALSDLEALLSKLSSNISTESIALADNQQLSTLLRDSSQEIDNLRNELIQRYGKLTIADLELQQANVSKSEIFSDKLFSKLNASLEAFSKQLQMGISDDALESNAELSLQSKYLNIVSSARELRQVITQLEQQSFQSTEIPIETSQVLKELGKEVDTFLKSLSSSVSEQSANTNNVISREQLFLETSRAVENLQKRLSELRNSVPEAEPTKVLLTKVSDALSAFDRELKDGASRDLGKLLSTTSNYWEAVVKAKTVDAAVEKVNVEGADQIITSGRDLLVAIKSEISDFLLRLTQQSLVSEDAAKQQKTPGSLGAQYEELLQSLKSSIESLDNIRNEAFSTNIGQSTIARSSFQKLSAESFTSGVSTALDIEEFRDLAKRMIEKLSGSISNVGDLPEIVTQAKSLQVLSKQIPAALRSELLQLSMEKLDKELSRLVEQLPKLLDTEKPVVDNLPPKGPPVQVAKTLKDSLSLFQKQLVAEKTVNNEFLTQLRDQMAKFTSELGKFVAGDASAAKIIDLVAGGRSLQNLTGKLRDGKGIEISSTNSSRLLQLNLRVNEELSQFLDQLRPSILTAVLSTELAGPSKVDPLAGLGKAVVDLGQSLEANSLESKYGNYQQELSSNLKLLLTDLMSKLQTEIINSALPLSSAEPKISSTLTNDFLAQVRSLSEAPLPEDTRKSLAEIDRQIRQLLAAPQAKIKTMETPAGERTSIKTELLEKTTNAILQFQSRLNTSARFASSEVAELGLQRSMLTGSSADSTEQVVKALNVLMEETKPYIESPNKQPADGKLLKSTQALSELLHRVQSSRPEDLPQSTKETLVFLKSELALFAKNLIENSKLDPAKAGRPIQFDAMLGTLRDAKSRLSLPASSPNLEVGLLLGDSQGSQQPFDSYQSISASSSRVGITGLPAPSAKGDVAETLDRPLNDLIKALDDLKMLVDRMWNERAVANASSYSAIDLSKLISGLKKIDLGSLESLLQLEKILLESFKKLEIDLKALPKDTNGIQEGNAKLDEILDKFAKLGKDTISKLGLAQVETALSEEIAPVQGKKTTVDSLLSSLVETEKRLEISIKTKEAFVVFVKEFSDQLAKQDFLRLTPKEIQNLLGTKLNELMSFSSDLAEMWQVGAGSSLQIPMAQSGAVQSVLMEINEEFLRVIEDLIKSTALSTGSGGNIFELLKSLKELSGRQMIQSKQRDAEFLNFIRDFKQGLIDTKHSPSASATFLEKTLKTIHQQFGKSTGQTETDGVLRFEPLTELPRKHAVVLKGIEAQIQTLLGGTLAVAGPDNPALDIAVDKRFSFDPNNLRRQESLSRELLDSLRDFESQASKRVGGDSNFSSTAKRLLDHFDGKNSFKPDTGTQKEIRNSLNELQQGLSDSSQRSANPKLTAYRDALRGLENIVRGQEMLRQLNPVMQAAGEPAMLLFPTIVQGLISRLEVAMYSYYGHYSPNKESSYREKKGKGEDEGEGKRERRQREQRYNRFHFKANLPNLGKVEVDFAHTIKEILLNIICEKPGASDVLSSNIGGLRTSLIASGFEKADVNIESGVPGDVRPEWFKSLMELDSLIA